MTLKRRPVRKMPRAKGMKNIPKRLLAQDKAQIKHYKAQQKAKTDKAKKQYDDAIERSKKNWKTLKAHPPGTAGHKAVTQVMREDMLTNEKFKKLKTKKGETKKGTTWRGSTQWRKRSIGPAGGAPVSKKTGKARKPK